MCFFPSPFDISMALCCAPYPKSLCFDGSYGDQGLFSCFAATAASKIWSFMYIFYLFVCFTCLVNSTATVFECPYPFVFQEWWESTSPRLRCSFQKWFTLPKDPQWSWNVSLWESKPTESDAAHSLQYKGRNFTRRAAGCFINALHHLGCLKTFPLVF